VGQIEVQLMWCVGCSKRVIAFVPLLTWLIATLLCAQGEFKWPCPFIETFIETRIYSCVWHDAFIPRVRWPLTDSSKHCLVSFLLPLLHILVAIINSSASSSDWHTQKKTRIHRYRHTCSHRLSLSNFHTIKTKTSCIRGDKFTTQPKLDQPCLPLSRTLSLYTTIHIHTYKHIRMSHITRMDEHVNVAGLAHERGMSHTQMGHATHTDEACHPHTNKAYLSYKVVKIHRMPYLVGHFPQISHQL